MLIDSGTAYTYITDPFVYKPSPDGVVLNETQYVKLSTSMRPLPLFISISNSATQCILHLDRFKIHLVVITATSLD